MDKMQEFIKCYNDVFDKYDNVTACGREKCKKLIIVCEKIKQDVDFGDTSTGMMNIENIVKLKKEIGENG